MSWYSRFFAGKVAARTMPVLDPWDDIIVTLLRSAAPPSDADLEGAYESCAPVFAAIQEIIQVCTGADITGGPGVVTLFEFPNEEQDWTQFCETILASYYTTGVAYIRKSNTGGTVQRLYHLRTSEVSRDSNGYTYRGQRLQRKELIIVRKASLKGPTEYASPIKPAWKSILIYQARSIYHEKMLTKLPAITAVIETGTVTAIQQRRNLGTSIDNIIGTEDKSTVVLPLGCKMTSPGILADPELDIIGQTCENNICACINVPVQLVGLRAGQVSSTYSNYATARRSLYFEAVAPILDMMSRIFSKDLGVDVTFSVPEPEEESAPAVGQNAQDAQGTEGMPDA